MGEKTPKKKIGKPAKKAIPKRAKPAPRPAKKPLASFALGIDTAKLAAALDAKRPTQSGPKKLAQTGISGLDSVLGGGIEEGAVIIVTGGPGTGKSTLGLQFLYHGATECNENGMYITFEEQKETIRRHAAKFGWNFEQLEREKKLVFLEYPPHEVDRFLSEGGIIEDLINEYRVKRIVIDSMTTFLMLYEDDYRRRQAFLKMMETLRKWSCTAVLTCESDTAPDGELRTRFGIEFLSDGLLALHTIHRGDVIDIALEIVKMRGMGYEHKLMPVRFTPKGIAAYPSQHVSLK